MLLVTLGYTVFELSWNLRLVDAVGADRRDDIYPLVESGRWLTAFGLVWAALKGSTAWRGLRATALNFAVFGASVFAAYGLIGYGFDRVVDTLTAEQRKTVLQLAVARSAGSLGEASDPVAKVLWPALLWDPAAIETAAEAYEATRERALGSLEKVEAKGWTDIVAARTRAAEVQAARGQVEGQARALYEKFVQASKALAGKSPTGWTTAHLFDRFRAETGGLAPQADISYADFLVLAQRSSIFTHRQLAAAALRYLQLEANPVVATIGSLQLRMSDVESMTRDQFERLVDERRAAVESVMPSSEAAGETPVSRDAVAAVVLPPIAMSLSLLGVLINTGTALGLVARLIGIRISSLVVAVALPIAVIVASVPYVGPPVMRAGIGGASAEYPVASAVVLRLASVQAELVDLTAVLRSSK